MSADIINLQPAMVGDGARIDPDRVLSYPLGTLEQAIVIGRRKDDGELYLASSEGGPQALWLIEHAKALLLDT